MIIQLRNEFVHFKIYIFQAVSVQEPRDIWSRYSDCVTMGRIHTSARIPADKYAYGQSIDLQVKVNNQTQRSIDKFIVYIIRVSSILIVAIEKKNSTRESTIKLVAFELK